MRVSVSLSPCSPSIYPFYFASTSLYIFIRFFSLCPPRSILGLIFPVFVVHISFFVSFLLYRFFLTVLCVFIFNVTLFGYTKLCGILFPRIVRAMDLNSYVALCKKGDINFYVYALGCILFIVLCCTRLPGFTELCNVCLVRIFRYFCMLLQRYINIL